MVILLPGESRHDSLAAQNGDRVKYRRAPTRQISLAVLVLMNDLVAFIFRVGDDDLKSQ